MDLKGSVFAEFTKLSQTNNSLNLGQGFPTIPVNPFILNALEKTTHKDIGTLVHQYARSEGLPSLVNELAEFYSPKMNRELNPLTEILITVGATEAIYTSIQAFINPGDEVILMQPFYDSYPASIKMAGGIPVYVSLVPTNTSSSSSSENWKLDFDILRSKITKKTKLIILNNPHNPLGKVFSKEELEKLAEILIEYDLLCLSDEVYETLVFTDSGTPFIKFGSLPDMSTRTITIGSSGKMFGITGWKIGWIISTPTITKSIQMVHQFVPFSVATPLQTALSDTLTSTKTTPYFSQTLTTYQSHRDKLFAILKNAGLRPTLPAAGYFIMANFDGFCGFVEGEWGDKRGRDYAFCRFLTEVVGITAIPPSAFYDVEDGDGERGRTAGGFARFAFCKTERDLDEAGVRFDLYFEKLKKGSK